MVNECGSLAGQGDRAKIKFAERTQLARRGLFWFSNRGPELRLAVRVAVAGLVAFAIGFALDQLRRNLGDLHARIAEFDRAN